MNKLLIRGFAFVILMLLQANESESQLVFMPESRHSQSRTYSLLFDEQTSVLLTSSGRALGLLGGYFTVMEASDLPGRPQVSIHGTVASYFTINTHGGPMLTEAVDARFGLAFDFEIDQLNRFSLILTHETGHLSDDVINPPLAAANLGNEILTFRFIHDIDNTARLGVSFRPNVSAEPASLVFGAEEFAEWFPWHPAKDSHSMAPFIGFSMEEYGHHTIDLSSNIMVGLATGNHLSGKKYTAFRTVIGYYSGVDVRLKYYEFNHSLMKFGYAGIQVDI